MSLASARGVVSSSSSSITGSSTRELVASWANDSIWLWVYTEPWLRSEALVPWFSAKYSEVVAWNNGVCSDAYPYDPAAPTTPHSTINHQNLRSEPAMTRRLTRLSAMTPHSPEVSILEEPSARPVHVCRTCGAGPVVAGGDAVPRSRRKASSAVVDRVPASRAQVTASPTQNHRNMLYCVMRATTTRLGSCPTTARAAGLRVERRTAISAAQTTAAMMSRVGTYPYRRSVSTRALSTDRAKYPR